MSAIGSTTASASNLKQAALHSQIAYTVAAKQLDAQKQQGQAAVRLLEAAAQLGKSLATGKQVDLQG